MHLVFAIWWLFPQISAAGYPSPVNVSKTIKVKLVYGTLVTAGIRNILNMASPGDKYMQQVVVATPAEVAVAVAVVDTSSKLIVVSSSSSNSSSSSSSSRFQ